MKKGFTFIELMAVIVILSILALLVMPKIFGRVEEAKATTALIQIKNLEAALRLFYLDNGFYPSTEQGLSSLVEKPATGRTPQHWRDGGYLESRTIPKDPWGTDYVYLSPGTNGDEYEIISYGADGKEGGEKTDADISSTIKPQ